MKNLFITVFIHLVFFGIVSFADNNNPGFLMKKGNENYSKQNYSEALENYSAILHQGLVSAELYYNLGNTYYRLGNIGYSILNFEKALKLAPGDDDIKYNLRLVNAHTTDKIEELPQLFLIEWWNSLVMTFSIGQWGSFVLGIYFLFIFIIGLYYYYRNSNYQKPLFFFGLINLVVLLLFSSLFISRISGETKNEYGILLENSANVKVSPDHNGNDAFIIHEGIKFIIEDKVNDWSKIKLNDGKVGWLNNDTFKTI